jgi:dephospho-CoA kinase
MKKQKTLLIGLTGGIGSGKSSAAREFKRLGAAVIDADMISRSILLPGKPSYKKVVKLFSEKILSADKTVNRKKLAEIAFSGVKIRKALEKATHPEIIEEIKTEIKRFSAKPVLVIDAPLLFETGLEKEMDKTVVVWAPGKVQAQRLKKRNGLSARQIKLRLDSQMSLNTKKGLADFVIDNSGDKSSLKKNVKNLWKLLTNL